MAIPQSGTLMDPDVERLRSLPCWSGPIEAEPLQGGITNRNYVVRDGERRCVVRMCRELLHLGIDRRSEAACQKAAHSLGVAPAVVHQEEGVLVSEFLAGKTCTAEDVREPSSLEHIAGALRTLHDAWDRVAGDILYFSPFQTVRTYTATARSLGASLPGDIDDSLEDARKLSREISAFVPALCHNDLLAANILDDGERVRFVDWEYGGMGNPLFDLAGISANCSLSPEVEATFLEAYGQPDERRLREMRILKTVSLLREALWATIQTVASDLDFDYGKYASDNLRAYREARSQLDA
ncbi:MAG: phosphotransferase family protein [Planctomycetota bacterium]|nr:phosphotransferase family protein [Planctomycetota bacterium]